ncbi:hypothetical protein PspLS_11619 [Pyricularia sp. CBS 133598]|nr:hypothetical protein PspLS_11619 [Pyricularia sp. CBS 133598]
MADCSAAVEVTTTPAAETITVTVATTTLAGAVTPPARLAKKAVPTVPSYGSACSNLARYSSACACWSAITNRTVEAPTSTVIVSATVTVTDTPEPTLTCDSQTCGTFKGANCGNNGCYCQQIDCKPRSLCSHSFDCGCSPACNLSSKCVNGRVCYTNTCCGSNRVVGKTGVCGPAPTPECQNPSPPPDLSAAFGASSPPD